MRILITGHSRGIGRAIAENLVRQGHLVWGVSRSLVSDSILKEQSKADISKWEDLENLSKDVRNEWGALDGLICSAGSNEAIGDSMRLDPRLWSKTVRNNLEGTFFTLRAFFELIQASDRRGKILCFSGGGACNARPRFSAYGVAKTGIVRLVETLGTEWKGLPIDINAIAPGVMKTRMVEEIIRLGPEVVGEDEYRKMSGLEEGDRYLQRLLMLIEFLLSSSSDGISGRLISAQFDPWEEWTGQIPAPDLMTLRRVPLGIESR